MGSLGGGGGGEAIWDAVSQMDLYCPEYSTVFPISRP